MKDTRRAKEVAVKRAAKDAAMRQPKAKSKYAIKKNEQRNGNYRPTSPFYLPPSMRDKGV